MLIRGRYGVEWTPRPKDDDSSVFGRIIVLVVVVAIVSLVWTAVRRWRQRVREAEENAKTAEVVLAVESAPPPAPSVTAAPPPQEETRAIRTALTKRPKEVRNLLLRLQEAEKSGDIAMAVTTIETIRALPGAPAADLDDVLARRLGGLNVRRLFDLKNAQWVATVEVKRGENATRIASEHGSTLASLSRLNTGDIDRLRIGQQIFVMDHPRFNLVVHRRSRMADLQLNGKFFKRYDLVGTPAAAAGSFEWREVKLPFSPADADELDTLLPRSAPVVISEV